MAQVRDRAVCIRHWDWSETSQTVSLFTREAGVIRGIAKGARRERAPFSGGIELITRGEMIAIVKPGSELATITAWDLQETFPAIRKSLLSFHAAMYMVDAAQHSIQDHDPHAMLFDALLDALRSLGSESDRLVAVKFLAATIAETGWAPELARDVVTGGPLSKSATYGFAPSLGGFTNEKITVVSGTSTPGPVWRVRGETLDLLRSVAPAQAAGGNGAQPVVVDRAGRLLNAYLSFVLGRELPTAAAVFGAKAS
jgi:DNA repair protein RecO (recombination protein O)